MTYSSRTKVLVPFLSPLQAQLGPTKSRNHPAEGLIAIKTLKWLRGELAVLPSSRNTNRPLGVIYLSFGGKIRLCRGAFHGLHEGGHNSGLSSGENFRPCSPIFSSFFQRPPFALDRAGAKPDPDLCQTSQGQGQLGKRRRNHARETPPNPRSGHYQPGRPHLFPSLLESPVCLKVRPPGTVSDAGEYEKCMLGLHEHTAVAETWTLLLLKGIRDERER